MIPLSSLILLLLPVASAVIAPTPIDDDDDVQTSFDPSYSACKSAFIGRVGADPTADHATRCREINACSSQYYLTSVADTKTEAPISLEPGRVVGTNSIQIVVQHAAVLERMVTKITLNPANAACNYPGANWKKGVHSNWATDNGRPVCRDTYISNIPWTTDCGMTRSENATHVTFLGKGTVDYQDVLGSLDGVALGARNVSSVIQFSIAQPKVIRDISTQVRILDEPRLLGAVTRQQFDFATGNATLTVALSLAAPLRTSALTSSTAPAGIVLESLGAADNTLCGNTKDAVCQQKYTFAIDPRELCQLDGTYSFSFAVACHPSVAGTADCPIGMTLAPLSISVVLDGEDICAVVQGLLAVSGAITPHGEFTPASFAFGPTKQAFFQDQTLHFQVTANSLNAFPFAKSRIITVEAQDKTGTRKSLYDVDAGGAVAGWAFQFAQDPANANANANTHRHQFSYVAAPSVFGDVERNRPVDSDIVVAVEVEFVNPVGPGGNRKRVIRKRLAPRQQTNNVRAAEANTRIQLQAADAAAAPAATTTTKADPRIETIESSAVATSLAASLVVVAALGMAM